jgi:hypothetical protein
MAITLRGVSLLGLSVLASMTKRLSKPPQGFRRRLLVTIFVSFVGFKIGCSAGRQPTDPPNVYRESRGEVTRVDTRQSDPYLGVVAFVRLNNGTLVRPTLYFKQLRQTLNGWKELEELGGLEVTCVLGMPRLAIPLAVEIREYLFLMRTPILRDKGNSGGSGEREWNPWVLQVSSADEIAGKKVITLLPYAELSERAAEVATPLKKVLELYTIAKSEQDEQARTPVPPRRVFP